MAKYSNTVRLGTIPTYGGGHMSVYCRIEIDDGELSICGVEGPRQSGNCVGSAGQIVMHMDAAYRRQINLAPGWTPAKVKKFVQIWNRWHLNRMRAGSPAQEQWLRENPVNAVYPESHYNKASAALAAAGLNPDESYIHNGEPYKYGTAWLHEDLPADVCDWLKSLPDTDQQPAWV